MNRIFFLALSFAALAGTANGKVTLKEWSVPARLQSQKLVNSADLPQITLVGDVTAPGAARVRVAMAETALGQNSKVRFTSLKDGESQTLDAAQLAMWGGKSALFNGDTVRVEAILGAGESDVTVQVDSVLAFSDEPVPGDSKASAGDARPESLCGTDNRVPLIDNRSGRLNGGCTGWLVANGAVLTAGHCDTVAGHILEVNVPASQSNGTAVAAAVRDQFPVLANSVTSVNGGVGKDWAVFRAGPNNLNEQAHVLHGFFRMTSELPAAGGLLRVTGCGVDNTPPGSDPNTCGGRNDAGDCTHPAPNAQTRTQQTATGPFGSENGAGGVISLSHSVDTEPANSGSPIIWEANGFTIGIHSHGGCTVMGGANAGTSFELNDLENTIAAVPGAPAANCRYVDLVKAPGGLEDGGIFQPFDTFGEAVTSVPAGGRISIVTGNYSVSGLVISKAMTISAPVGPVRLGN